MKPAGVISTAVLFLLLETTTRDPETNRCHVRA